MSQLGWNKNWIVRLRSTKKIAVAEDWYPTINGLIDVRLYEYRNNLWRIVVVGGDDTCMKLDMNNEQKIRMIFDRICHLVTRADLCSLGFQYD